MVDLPEPRYEFIEGKRCKFHDGLAVVKHSCGEYLCKECIRETGLCPECHKPVKLPERKKTKRGVEATEPSKETPVKETALEKVSGKEEETPPPPPKEEGDEEKAKEDASSRKKKKDEDEEDEDQDEEDDDNSASARKKEKFVRL